MRYDIEDRAMVSRVGRIMENRLAGGFTLIELMTVVAVIAILAVIAYPSYQEQVRKTYRSDAQGNLMEVASYMERYFTENNTYVGAAIPSNLDDVPENGNLRYKLSIVSQTAASFQLKATAQSGSGQNNDACGDMTISNTGAKTHTGSLSGCWQ